MKRIIDANGNNAQAARKQSHIINCALLPISRIDFSLHIMAFNVRIFKPFFANQLQRDQKIEHQLKWCLHLCRKANMSIMVSNFWPEFLNFMVTHPSSPNGSNLSPFSYITHILCADSDCESYHK
jgi:hypothetical protein